MTVTTTARPASTCQCPAGAALDRVLSVCAALETRLHSPMSLRAAQRVRAAIDGPDTEEST